MKSIRSWNQVKESLVSDRELPEEMRPTKMEKDESNGIWVPQPGDQLLEEVDGDQFKKEGYTPLNS